MRAVCRDEMQSDPVSWLSQPLLVQSGAVSSSGSTPSSRQISLRGVVSSISCQRPPAVRLRRRKPLSAATTRPRQLTPRSLTGNVRDSPMAGRCLPCVQPRIHFRVAPSNPLRPELIRCRELTGATQLPKLWSGVLDPELIQVSIVEDAHELHRLATAAAQLPWLPTDILR
jgi:hypothetical protein